MDPARTVILFEEGSEASRRATLLVGRIRVLMVLEWISRGMSSVPIWPDAFGRDEDVGHDDASGLEESRSFLGE